MELFAGVAAFAVAGRSRREQCAVAHVNHLGALGRNPRIVGDDDEGGAGCFGRVREDPEHFRARLLIERAGGLIGKDHTRGGDERPGDRDALRLPTGEFPGPAVLHALQAEVGEPSARHLGCFLARRAREHEREGDVLIRGKFREQLPRLKHESEVGASQQSAFGVGKR